jgi:uncharacterized protein YjbI with pentapeptide repeats
MSILRAGPESSNQFREQNPEVHYNFFGKDFSQFGLKDADLAGANLSHSDMRYTHIEGVDFSRCNLKKSKLTGASFVDCTFVESDLSYVWCEKTNDESRTVFELCDFTRAVFRNAQFINCEFRNSTFRNTLLPNTSFVGSAFIDTNPPNADILQSMLNNGLPLPNLSNCRGLPSQFLKVYQHFMRQSWK